MSPRDVFPSLVMLPSPQVVSWLWQGVLPVAHARVAWGVVAWLWCTYLPHLVHFLTFLSLVGYVSPPLISLPCYGSFVAAREFGLANGVFRQCMRGVREGMMAYAWCIAMPLLVPLFIVLSLLGYVSHITLPSRVMLPLRQLVSWEWQGLLSVAHARAA